MNGFAEPTDRDTSIKLDIFFAGVTAYISAPASLDAIRGSSIRGRLVLVIRRTVLLGGRADIPLRRRHVVKFEKLCTQDLDVV